MIYKQPLIVNVNIEFTSLVEGVLAHYSEDPDFKIPTYEKNSFKTIDQVLMLNAKSQNIDGSLLPTVVPTLGGIIRSFQPVVFSEVNYGYGKYATKDENISTRNDVMIGGNGMAVNRGTSSIVNEGVSAYLSPFNAAYQYATGNALAEGNFATSLLDGVTSFVTGAANGIGSVAGALNGTVNKLSSVANAVTLGYFGTTPIAQEIRKVQGKVNENVGYLGQAAGAMRTINGIVQTGTSTIGSILDWPLD